MRQERRNQGRFCGLVSLARSRRWHNGFSLVYHRNTSTKSLRQVLGGVRTLWVGHKAATKRGGLVLSTGIAQVRLRCIGRRYLSDGLKPRIENNTNSRMREIISLAGHIAFGMFSLRVLKADRGEVHVKSGVMLKSCHIGIIALSYMVRDIMWLRSLSIVASVLSIAYNYHIPHRPLWLVINWNILFILLNLMHVAYLYYERRDLPMTEEEEAVYNERFAITFPRNDFVRFVRRAKWGSAEKGQVLFREGEMPSHVYYIIDGTVTVSGVTVDRKYEIGDVSRGHFMGDMSYLLRDVSPVTVVVQKKIRYLCWDRAYLDWMSENEVRLHQGFLAVLGRGLVADVSHYWLERMKVQKYSFLLRGVVLKSYILPEERKELEEYRIDNNVEWDEHHEALSLIGWTEKEFNVGNKNHD